MAPRHGARAGAPRLRAGARPARRTARPRAGVRVSAPVFVLDADVYTALAQVRDARVPAVLATVVDAVGSTPQEAGAKLLLTGDGQQAGTIGGGAIEARGLDEAKTILADDTAKTRLLEVNLTTELGMCCGGTMSLFLERVTLPARLVVLGAGHIARPLVELAGRMGFVTAVIDGREAWADRSRFPTAG